MSEASDIEGLPAGLVRALSEAIHGMHYGTVQIVIHDSKIVQIERNERIRVPVAKSREGDAADLNRPTARP